MADERHFIQSVCDTLASPVENDAQRKTHERFSSRDQFLDSYLAGLDKRAVGFVGEAIRIEEIAHLHEFVRSLRFRQSC